MTIDTTSRPYSAIAIVVDTIGDEQFQASGVLITPDELLTASHVVYSANGGKTATNIQVAPGYSPGVTPFGVFAGGAFHYFPVGNPDDTISVTDTQTDYAVIHLTAPVRQASTMNIAADFPGGAVDVTGYPGTANGDPVDLPQTVALLSGYSVYYGTALGAGSSGGPVWSDGPTGPTVDGLVSSEDADGTGYFAHITAPVEQQIKAWAQSDDAANPLVDSIAYYAENPDVAAAGVSATTHYENNGWKEGRNPDDLFSTAGYLAANPDVQQADFDPMLHYEDFGWKEGRDPSAAFDTTLYLLRNPDVAAAGIDPLQHYLAFGQYEGRPTFAAVGPASQIIAGFDREYYLLANPDVARAGVDPLRHYETIGWKEGRKPDEVFDPKYYLEANPDVAAAGVDPLTQYDNFGWHEGRNPSQTFNTDAYLAKSPDVAAAGINPLEHYLQFGIYEGRAIT